MEELIENYAFEDVFRMIQEIEELKYSMLQMSLSLEDNSKAVNDILKLYNRKKCAENELDEFVSNLEFVNVTNALQEIHENQEIMKKVFCKTINYAQKIGKDELYQRKKPELKEMPTKTFKDAATTTSLDPMEIIIVKKNDIFDLLDDDGYDEASSVLYDSTPVSSDFSSSSSESENDEEKLSSSGNEMLSKKEFIDEESESATPLDASMTDISCSDAEEEEIDREENVQGPQKNDKKVEKDVFDVVQDRQEQITEEERLCGKSEKAPKILKIHKQSETKAGFPQNTSKIDCKEDSESKIEDIKEAKLTDIPDSLSSLKNLADKISSEDSSRISPQFSEKEKLPGRLDIKESTPEASPKITGKSRIMAHSLSALDSIGSNSNYSRKNSCSKFSKDSPVHPGLRRIESSSSFVSVNSDALSDCLSSPPSPFTEVNPGDNDDTRSKQSESPSVEVMPLINKFESMSSLEQSRSSPEKMDEESPAARRRRIRLQMIAAYTRPETPSSGVGTPKRSTSPVLELPARPKQDNEDIKKTESQIEIEEKPKPRPFFNPNLERSGISIGGGINRQRVIDQAVAPEDSGTESRSLVNNLVKERLEQKRKAAEAKKKNNGKSLNKWSSLSSLRRDKNSEDEEKTFERFLTKKKDGKEKIKNPPGLMRSTTTSDLSTDSSLERWRSSMFEYNRNINRAKRYSYNNNNSNNNNNQNNNNSITSPQQLASKHEINEESYRSEIADLYESSLSSRKFYKDELEKFDCQGIKHAPGAVIFDRLKMSKEHLKELYKNPGLIVGEYFAFLAPMDRSLSNLRAKSLDRNLARERAKSFDKGIQQKRDGRKIEVDEENNNDSTQHRPRDRSSSRSRIRARGPSADKAMLTAISMFDNGDIPSGIRAAQKEAERQKALRALIEREQEAFDKLKEESNQLRREILENNRGRSRSRAPESPKVAARGQKRPDIAKSGTQKSSPAVKKKNVSKQKSTDSTKKRKKSTDMLSDLSQMMTSGLMKLIGQGQSNGPVNGRADESTKPKDDQQNDVVSPRPCDRDNNDPAAIQCEVKIEHSLFRKLEKKVSNVLGGKSASSEEKQNSAPKRSETEMVNKMVDHSKTKSSKNSTCKNSNKLKNRDVQEKREKQGSSRMKSLRKKQSLLRMVQSGAGCYSKGPLTPIMDESPTTSRSSTPITMKKLKPMEKYESEDEDDGDEVTLEILEMPESPEEQDILDKRIRMDDVNALIKEKYAKDAAYQEEMDQARKASSVLEDPLIKKIREQEEENQPSALEMLKRKREARRKSLEKSKSISENDLRSDDVIAEQREKARLQREKLQEEREKRRERARQERIKIEEQRKARARRGSIRDVNLSSESLNSQKSNKSEEEKPVEIKKAAEINFDEGFTECLDEPGIFFDPFTGRRKIAAEGKPPPVPSKTKPSEKPAESTTETASSAQAQEPPPTKDPSPTSTPEPSPPPLKKKTFQTDVLPSDDSDVEIDFNTGRRKSKLRIKHDDASLNRLQKTFAQKLKEQQQEAAAKLEAQRRKFGSMSALQSLLLAQQSEDENSETEEDAIRRLNSGRYGSQAKKFHDDDDDVSYLETLSKPTEIKKNNNNDSGVNLESPGESATEPEVSLPGSPGILMNKPPEMQVDLKSKTLEVPKATRKRPGVKPRRPSVPKVKMIWTEKDEANLDEQFLKMIGPIPAAPFEHRHVDVRPLKVVGYNGFDKKITDEYNVAFKPENQLGSGRFGKVYLGSTLDGSMNLAFKACAVTRQRSISKVNARKRAERLTKEDVKFELALMNQLNHPNIVKVYDAIEHDCYVTLVLEHMTGGELFDRIVQLNYDPTELDVVIYMKQICEGVSYLHKNQILHLDLKPENIVCVSPETHWIKIIDFGLARRYIPHQRLQVNFGTPEFVSPEVVNYNFVSYASDMWSVGVICYILVSGNSPFLGDDEDDTMANIQDGEWEFCEEFDDVSDDCRDFIKRLIVYQKGGRMSANQCLAHPWISSFASKRQGQLRSRLKIKRRINKIRWWKAVDAINAVTYLMRRTSVSSETPCN